MKILNYHLNSLQITEMSLKDILSNEKSMKFIEQIKTTTEKIYNLYNNNPNELEKQTIIIECKKLLENCQVLELDDYKKCMILLAEFLDSVIKNPHENSVKMNNALLNWISNRKNQRIISQKLLENDKLSIDFLNTYFQLEINCFDFKITEFIIEKCDFFELLKAQQKFSQIITKIIENCLVLYMYFYDLIFM